MTQGTAPSTTLFSEATKERVPGAPPPLPPSPQAHTDRALDELRAASTRWIETGIPDRIALLGQCMESLAGVAEGWAAAGCAEKGIPASESIGGQEWVGGPMPVMRNLRQYRDALKAGGAPIPPALERRGDRFVARVMPGSLFEKLAFGGLAAEVWIEPGHEASQGRNYRGPRHPGVALVLGAGNQSSIGPGDTLSKLFAEDEVVLLKMNPVNEHTGPFLEKAFAPLVAGGFLRVVYGGAEVGQRLTPDPRLDSIHITGSARTHDAIVWGPAAEQAERKRRKDPIFKKPITSELGSVTPCMIVPGPWSERDLEFQARHVASMVTYNAGFTCTSTQVLVLSSTWPQKEAFVQKVADALARHPARPAYYPGATSRKQGFRDRYPGARTLGAVGPASLPYLLIPHAPDEDYALREEAFCGLLACVEVEGATAPEFLQSAVRFCNDKLWGTLSCALLVDPQTARAHAGVLEGAIAELRYGTIGINVWGGVGYGIVTTPWGAYPGHTTDDVVSGIGFVHNTYFFDHPEKSVLRAPFHMNPTPAWFTDHKNLREVGRLGSRFEQKPGLARFLPLALAGMKG